MSDLVLYTSNDGRTRLDLRIEGRTVWLTQLEIAELFQTTKQNVSLHAKNIFSDGELSPEATVKESLTVQSEGKREVQRTILLYNLDLILAIGYRVRSPRGVQFRQWASSHLKEYLVKGFVMDDERLKNPGSWDYFDELLARISEIRASEKRFYQKVRDLFALSSDYEAREKETQVFFAEVQNKLLYAATRQTAREWRDANPGKDGNMRDDATLEQLLVLANLENMNAEFIHMTLPQSDRIKRLNAIAIRQMQTLTARTVKQLEGGKT